MKQPFFYKKCLMIVFALVISQPLIAMEGDFITEIDTTQKEEATSAPADGTFKQTVQNAAEKFGQTVTRVKSWINEKLDDSVATQPVETNEVVTKEVETPHEQENVNEGKVETPLQDITEIKPAGSNKLLYVGGTVLGLTVIGGIVYLLHKKGLLTRIEKVVKDYPLISTATASALCGMVFGYALCNY
jgi:hypothetical protein